MRVLLEIGHFYLLNLRIIAGLIRGQALLEVLRYSNPFGHLLGYEISQPCLLYLADTRSIMCDAKRERLF